MVAEGSVTRGEFAAVMVQQTILPNPWTYSPSQLEKWRAAQLEIRPLQLILEVIDELGSSHGGSDAAYITPNELIRVCIPLAGTKATSAEIANAIGRHRTGRLDVSGWPDCAPGANDVRLAKEFLRFLANFGICRRIPIGPSLNDKYQIEELEDPAAVVAIAGDTIFAEDANADQIVEAARRSRLPSIIERQRTMVSILARPGQARFREHVLNAYDNRCFLTGDSMGEILEAAHIIPVEYGGADEPDNGICLRVDVHRLFDSGNIRIRPTGELVFSDALRASRNYGGLPGEIDIPPFVNPTNIQWRDLYY